MTARGASIAEGIVNGGRSNAQIHDAVIHAIAETDFAVGVSNEFGSARLTNVQIRAEGGLDAFGVANQFEGQPELIEVVAVATGPGNVVGVLASGAVTASVDRSTLEGSRFSVETRDNARIDIGASQLVGPKEPGSSVRCVVSYNGVLAPLDAGCNP